MENDSIEDKHSHNSNSLKLKQEALDIIRLAREHSKVCEPFRKALASDLEESNSD
jgi:hypothetical protein